MVTAVALFLLAPQPGQWSLRSGAAVSFVFVQPLTKEVWRPNGAQVPYESLPRPETPLWSAGEQIPVLLAVTNFKQAGNPGPTVRFKLPSTGEMISSFTSACYDKGIWVSGLKPEAQPAQQDLAVGIADGPWTTIGWVSYKQNHPAVQVGQSFKFDLHEIPSKNGSSPVTTVAISGMQGPGESAVRVVVAANGGALMPLIGTQAVPGRPGVTNYLFAGRLADVASVKLQTCPYEWHTIWAAHFTPKGH